MLLRFLSAFTGISAAVLIALLLQIVIYSPISPDVLELPLFPSELKTNNLLQIVDKIGEGILDRPEDVEFDKEGTLYTATRDGWIKRMHKNGSWEDWKMIGGPSLLGVSMSMDGDLLVCDAYKGLLKVGEAGVTVLTSEVEGSKFRLADDVIEASDGSAYFSIASTKFGLQDWFLDVLEAKPHGLLLKYDHSTKKTSILLSDLAFPNGVALSPNQDFLVICETWKFRCLRHWLKGESIGKTDIFIDNLPGGPDNINLAADGSFWIALLELRSPAKDFIYRCKAAKHIVATFPKLLQLVGGVGRKATVVNVDLDGKILKSFDDSEGKVMWFVTSAREYEGHLYLGNLETDFIGKLQLN